MLRKALMMSALPLLLLLLLLLLWLLLLLLQIMYCLGWDVM
jgi:hypothetical protein